MASDWEVPRISVSPTAERPLTDAPLTADAGEGTHAYTSYDASSSPEPAASSHGYEGVHIPIVIELDPDAAKPYLGGFRDTRTGKEYHHAYTETPVERVSKWANAAPRFSRETQTTDMSTRSSQTYRECAIQTKRAGLHQDTSHDREMIPRPYFSAAELTMVREAKALTIQCRWRGFVARRRAKAVRERLAVKREEREREGEKRRTEMEAKHMADIERRLHPRTAEDFAVLYDEVEAWRAAETVRIKADVTDEREQQTALALLLAKETALLSTIERLRISARKENAEKAVQSKMDAMSAPKRWQLSGGATAAVHTPFTTRAAELKALYEGLAMDLPTDDRLDLLTHVKYTVLEFECALTKELIALLDREVDMLNRGRSAESLGGLRLRLKNLFLTFCNTPEFNPEAARFSKLPAKVSSV